jgi:hypothetical protein
MRFAGLRPLVAAFTIASRSAMVHDLFHPRMADEDMAVPSGLRNSKGTDALDPGTRRTGACSTFAVRGCKRES